ncbi:lytic murein transglycosylase [uncultured Bilophila sp.]|uniref:lytic murein transglycosylase n=1 Tax=uncultured Bilophila sp. TaxID=529385 RepID=UPI0025F7AF8B|nr:lytic murein transglycosylase [uncultured Bilophila sp.]
MWCDCRVLAHRFSGALLMLFVLLGTGCASQETSPSLEQSAVFPSYQGSYASAPIPAEWIPLYQRLRADGLDGPDLPRYFSMMGTPSQDPMGRKIKELYTKAFAPKPKPTPSAKPSKPRPKVYPGVITAENVEKCRAFLAENAAAFDFAERTYGVPREIAVSLLFVETRLGTFLGKEKAFYTLASMASSRQPDDISSYLDRLPGASGRLGWIQERMEQRSDWAYKEFVALLGNVRASHLDALGVPGSVYGAIGLCQFMPSNIAPYGADGDGDGTVNLFTVPDAVASLSNYLAMHGWNKASTRAARHKVIKTYNRIDIYANTILGLAEAQGYRAD